MFIEILMSLLSVNIFAFAFILIHKIDTQLNPLQITFFRGLFTIIGIGLLFMILLSFQELQEVNSRYMWYSGASGVCAVVFGDIAFISSQKKISPPIASTITSTIPIMTMIFEVIFLEAQFNIFFLFSTIITGIGIIMIVKVQYSQNHLVPKEMDLTDQDKKEFQLEKSLKSKIIEYDQKYLPSKFGIGITLGLIASVLWAGGSVFYRAALLELDNSKDFGSKSFLMVNIIRYGTIFGVMLIIMSISLVRKPLHKENHQKNVSLPLMLESKKMNKRKLLLYMVIIAVLMGIVGDFVYSETLRFTSATFVAIISMTLPLFSIPWNYWINKEMISKKFIPGIIITLLGVIILIVGA